VYAASHPNTHCLCSDYKHAVYNGVVDIDELDPYVMLYRRLELFLMERGEHERLELVRRCFYYKGGKKLSRPPARGIRSWQRVLMEKLVDAWGWDAAKLRQLDMRASWNISDVEKERRALVAELTSSYRFLTDFSREQEIGASIDAREMNILGRKLYAAFERKAGKVEVVNPGVEINVAESELSFCSLGGDGSTQLWSVHAELVPANDQPLKRALKQAPSLTELMSWCVINGVAGERSRIAVREKLDGLSYSEADNMLGAIREFIGSHPADDSDHQYANPVKPIAVLLLVNVAADPHGAMRERGLHRISSRTDSLGFSATRENLVRNIEMIIRNSWGEIICTRYEGAAGLLRCLRDYLHMGPVTEGTSRPRAVVRSFCASRAIAIERRIQELFDDVDMDFDAREPDRGGRYVLEIENTLHLISRHGQLVSTSTAGDEIGLMRLLAEPQRSWNPLTIDRYAMQNSPLVLLSEYLKPDVISVFCESRPRYCVITVIDERGAIFSAPYQPEREHTALAATDQFLPSVRERQDTLNAIDESSSHTGRRPPRFFSLYKESGSNKYGIKAIDMAARNRNMPYLKVQAIASRDDDNHTVFSIYVDNQAFHEIELRERFPIEVANYIVQSRHDREAYAVYINDLDLSCLAADIDPSLQTIHYLRYRFHLESMINRHLLENL